MPERALTSGGGKLCGDVIGDKMTADRASCYVGATTSRVPFGCFRVLLQRSHLPHARFYIVDVPSGAGTQRVAIRALRKMHAKAPLTPILAVLHSPALKALKAALEAGASDVIDAPYDTAALSKRLLVLRERLRRAAQPAPRATGPELSARMALSEPRSLRWLGRVTRYQERHPCLGKST